MSEEKCCGCISTESGQDYDTTMHVGAIFIVFAVSWAGSLLPVLTQKVRWSTDSILMDGISAFAFGVVLATGLIHMANEGIEKLSDECLGPIVVEYGCLGLAVILITMILMHFIECESSVFFGSEGSAFHGHGHAHEEEALDIAELGVSTRKGSLVTPHLADNPYQIKTTEKIETTSNRRPRIATLIFEVGVMFHSLVIGLDLGVSTGEEFNTLLTALCFHQFFEGVAIGNAAIGSTESRSKLMLLNLAFAVTTPIGQAFGIAIHSSYSGSSATSLWVQGIFDCVAAGILLYTGLVELLTYNMTKNQKFLSRSAPQRYTLYACLWSGAALMALIASNTTRAMARASAMELFGFVQSGASRLQHTVNQHLHLLSAASPATVSTAFEQVTVSPSCSFRSTFVHSPSNETSTASNSVSAASSEGHLHALSIDGVALLIVSFLDGESLSRVQGVNTAWRSFIQQYKGPLYRSLVEERRVFHTVITSTSVFKSYLFSLRHEFDRELAHTHAVHPTHHALEQYCASTENHGFVAMFCDIIEFRDPRIARFVAWKRQSALSMVLAATPDHVMNFRKRSSYVGPITFVPVDNPLWPVFTSSSVDAPGFMGYAFDHVIMVKGYEALKDTVVKSILKELMIFDTTENAAAYGRSVGRAPYAAILEDEDAQVQVGQAERISHLTFSSPLRRQLSKYPVAERIRRMRDKIKAVDDCIAATPNNTSCSSTPA